MSSFLVSDKTINNIVTGLTSESWIDCLMWEYPFKDIMKEDEDFNKFGKELINLNYLALNERYNQKIPEINFNFEFENSGIIQFYKNLGCFLYQCSEGKAIKTKLYKDLKKIENALAQKIVSDLPEYDKAKWGF